MTKRKFLVLFKVLCIALAGLALGGGSAYLLTQPALGGVDNCRPAWKCPPTTTTTSTTSGCTDLHCQLGFNSLAADEQFNEPACSAGTCSGELLRWDAKAFGAFAGWQNIALTGSVLDIQAVWNGSGWTGGWLEGLNVGRFVPPFYAETRAASPAVYGMWPAPGWTWSAPYGSTCGVEIDYGELLGRAPTSVPETVHSCTTGLTKSAALSTSISNWHTYAAAVYLDHVDFYVDGQRTNTTYNTELSGTVNRTSAQDLNVDLTVGACGSWADCPLAGTGTQHMQVDYTQAWTP